MAGYPEEGSACAPEAKTAEEDDAATADAAESEGPADDLAELMDLIDSAEESGGDVEALTAVLRDIGRRIRATPNDRDLLTDFEGVTNICKALSEPPHSWKGEAMLMFCKIMPDVCRTSTVNRGSLRDEGFLPAAVELLRSAVADKDEEAAIAGCLALSATCTANDGNKKVVAQLLESTQTGKPGGMLLCLDALSCFSTSVTLQTEAICALRTIMTDDDPRKSDSEPSAAENREVALSDEGFPFLGIVAQNALDVADKCEKPNVRLLEQTLLLLREMARRQDYVKAMALDAKLLPRVQAALQVDDPRVVRASLAVLRAFCCSEEVRDEIGLLSDCAHQASLAVYKHIEVAVVCEQGFGLFGNLCMRKESNMAGKLNEGDKGVVALAQMAMKHHRSRADVARAVMQVMRNVATQDEAACVQIKEESTIFEDARGVVKEHEGESRWKSAVDIARQFLREFRADEGMLKKAVYNAYY